MPRKSVSKVKPGVDREGCTGGTGAGAGRARGVGTWRGRLDWGAAFLGALIELGHVGRAAQAVKIDRRTIWYRRQVDAEFARAYEEAMGIAAQVLEDEAVRRARDGVRRLKFNARTGEPYVDPETGRAYVEHVYSDALLMMLLRLHFPERYRERQEVEHAGKAESPVWVLTEELRSEVMERWQEVLGRVEG